MNRRGEPEPVERHGIFEIERGVVNHFPAQLYAPQRKGARSSWRRRVARQFLLGGHLIVSGQVGFDLVGMIASGKVGAK